MHAHTTDGVLGKNLRDLVFGLEDGLVSTMGSVVGIAAGSTDRRVVILSGIVIVAVEALSMAAGTFLSSKSHCEMLEKKIREEEVEIETHPEEEREELRQMYQARGFSPEEVAILVKRITSDKKLWLEEMMAKELQIGKAELTEPKEGALVMGVAYVIGGMVPVVPFFFLPLGLASIVSVAATLSCLFMVGNRKAAFTGQSPWRGGLEMLAVSSLAALLGYAIGRLVGSFSGLTLEF
jgi:VIT1/CCC1 family predicted Fe2+/Mn2+ transporter